MSNYTPPVFPEKPYTASVYFNYSSFIDKDQKGHLHLAPELDATLNVLAGNGTDNPLFSQDVIAFFKEHNAIVGVTSDQPIEGYLDLFTPEKGYGLYAPAGGIFLKSKADLRFAVEDTLAGITMSKKAGRKVIGLYRDYARPASPRHTLFRSMKEQGIDMVSDVHRVPQKIMELSKFRYDHGSTKLSHILKKD